MTRNQHLLTILGEECNEVAQRCSKALRFGVDEIYEGHPDGQKLTNKERITVELDDLFAVAHLLYRDGIITKPCDERREAKLRKVEKFLSYSRECGTLTEP